VEEILSRFLGVRRRMSARSAEERIAAADDLLSAVERIKELPRDEQLNALAEAKDNVTELETQAKAAMALCAQHRDAIDEPATPSKQISLGVTS
jgi:hypothetical protein